MPAGPENFFNLVFRRASMRGFIIVDRAAEFAATRKRIAAFVNDGPPAWRVDEQHGFANAPETLMRLFAGANRGKQVLKLD